MNKKLKWFNALVAMLLVAVSFGMSSCGDDDETQNGWYIDVDTEMSSPNFTSNLYVQSAVKNYLSSYNAELRSAMLTQKEAEKRFAAYCSDLESKVNAMQLPVLDNTTCTVYLTHAISDPDGLYPKIAVKSITFAPHSASL